MSSAETNTEAEIQHETTTKHAAPKRKAIMNLEELAKLSEQNPQPPLAKRQRVNQELLNDVKIEVIHKTQDILIINKPADLHLDGAAELTVEKLVNKQFPEMLKSNEGKPGATEFRGERRKLKLAHQLDYATSGVLCLAFTRNSCSDVALCFQERRAQKIYVALVSGHVEVPQGTTVDGFEVKSYIGEDREDVNAFKMCNVDEAKLSERKDAREAVTKVNVLSHGTYKGKPVSKVVMKLCTGRRHQLRLHMLKLGHPILGDATYGGDLASARMCLHAWKLYLPIMRKKKLVNEIFVQTKDPFESMVEDEKKLSDIDKICKCWMPQSHKTSK